MHEVELHHQVGQVVKSTLKLQTQSMNAIQQQPSAPTVKSGTDFEN
jgi:hypothetical protein